MDAGDKLGAEGAMDRTMPFDPAHIRKGPRPDRDAEMAFATLAIASVAPVVFAFIKNFKPCGGKGRHQPSLDFITCRHFSHVPSSKCREIA